jgi:hypothetical protein
MVGSPLLGGFRSSSGDHTRHGRIDLRHSFYIFAYLGFPTLRQQKNYLHDAPVRVDVLFDAATISQRKLLILNANGGGEMTERLLSREELFDLVWSKPIRHLAKEFGISDVGLAKVCARYNIPRPERGYWQQLAVGKAPERPQLPPAVGEENIRFAISESGSEHVPPPELLEWIARERDPANKISVLDVTRRYHPLVRATKDMLSGQGVHADTLAIRVSEALRPRALRLWQALVQALDERGFHVGKQDSWHRTNVTVLGEEVGLWMDERPTKVEHTASDLASRNYLTGRLRFVVEYRGTRERVKDRPEHPIEEQLNEVIISLVRVALEVARPDRLKEEQRARDRAEEQRQQQIFRERCDSFQAIFNAWKEQQERLAFLVAIEGAFTNVESPTDSMREYMAWTRRYVEWADPIGRFFEALRTGEHGVYHHFTDSLRRW